MKEQEKCIICENADEVLKAINEHPKAIMHLSKRQIRRLGREIAKAHFENVVDGFNHHSPAFYMTKDGSIAVKKGQRYKVVDVVREVEADIVSQTIKELNPVIKSSVDSLVKEWLDTGCMQNAITASVRQTIKDCGSKLIEFALKSSTTNEG